MCWISGSVWDSTEVTQIEPRGFGLSPQVMCWGLDSVNIPYVELPAKHARVSESASPCKLCPQKTRDEHLRSIHTATPRIPQPRKLNPKPPNTKTVCKCCLCPRVGDYSQQGRLAIGSTWRTDRGMSFSPCAVKVRVLNF